MWTARGRFICTGIYLLTLGALVTDAQTTGATVFGIIRDPNRAIVPAAQVAIRNAETGVSRSQLTGEDGAYRAPNLQPGTYDIEVLAQGFAPAAKKGIKVNVGGELLVDFELRVGNVIEVIEVREQEVVVDVATSTVTHNVGGKTIRELPLNGRDWTQLATLQPGIASVGTSGGTRSGNGVKLTVSGARPSENNFRMDGLSLNDYANNTPGNILGVNLGVEAVREFTVVTNSYSAEYGRSSGGVINAVTRSGTNEMHGSLYYFHRNSALDARNFFDREQQPAFRRHQYGAAVGGPVIRNRTFWFADFESVREFLGQTNIANTPSASARTGRLAAGAVNVDPDVMRALSLYPLPNGPLNGNGDTGQYFSVVDRKSRGNYVIGKMDHRFSDAAGLTGSYFYDQGDINQPDIFRNFRQGNQSRRHAASMEYTHTFGPALVSVTRAGFVRTVSLTGDITDVLNPAIEDTSLGFIPGKPVGSIAVPGLTSLPAGPGSIDYANIFFNSYQIYQNVYIAKGRHALKLGANVERMHFNYDLPNLIGGQFSFGSLSDFLANRPNVFAALYPGSDTQRGLRQTIAGAYIQDDFRWLSNLTLNLGVRYEMATIPTEVNGKIALLRNLTDSQVTVGGPIHGSNPTLRNFSPRVGLAWDPGKNGKTSVRAGFGMFDVLPLLNLYDTPLSRSTPFFRQGIATNPPVGSFPAAAYNLLGVQNLRTAYVDFDPLRAYSMKWNLTIQQDVRGWLVEAGYTGSRGVHLPLVERNMNTVVPVPTDNGWVYPVGAQVVNPNFSAINTTNTWNADSNYHGLQLSTKRSFSTGLQVLGSYTWSKSIDTGSSASSVAATSGYATAIAAPTPLLPVLNRGLSDFDIRHNAVLSAVWEVPMGANLKSFAKHILAGWQLGGIYRAQTGLPFTVALNNDRAGSKADTTGQSLGQRPNLVLSQACATLTNPGNPNRYIKTECFTFPAANILGNLGRNTLTAPGLSNLDFALIKNSRVTEKLGAQFRMEFFNAANRANFAAPNQIIFDSRGNLTPNIGIITATTTANRQIQMGLKLNW